MEAAVHDGPGNKPVVWRKVHLRFHDEEFLHSVLGSMFAAVAVGSSWGSSSRVANGRQVVQFATLMTYNPENSA